jgi:glucokinase
MNDFSHAMATLVANSHEPPAPARPPGPWLLADIGGTNVRFGWLAESGDTVSHVHTLRGIDHPGPGSAARAYLARVAQSLGAAYRAPRAAAFAVATSVVGDEVAFTNSGWRFSREQTRRDLGLDTLLLLNDFEALALSLPGLRQHQVRLIPCSAPLRVDAAPPGARPGTADPAGPANPANPAEAAMAVIGPGTGLGVAGLLPTRQGWVAVPGEGGHASLSAADDFEAALLAAVRREHAHVSAERLLSGIGLPVLHAAVAAVLGRSAQAHAAMSGALTANAIVERGLAGQDEVCSRTLDSFCALLGSFAGNVALVLGARGGVYIGGGIVPRLGDRFFASKFRQRFEAKGRFEAYLQAVPTALITDTLAALGGTALALQQHRP